MAMAEIPEKSAAPRSGVSDQPNTDALPPKLAKLTKFTKLIEPRARRASPQSDAAPDKVLDKVLDATRLRAKKMHQEKSSHTQYGDVRCGP